MSVFLKLNGYFLSLSSGLSQYGKQEVKVDIMIKDLYVWQLKGLLAYSEKIWDFLKGTIICD